VRHTQGRIGRLAILILAPSPVPTLDVTLAAKSTRAFGGYPQCTDGVSVAEAGPR
jgi:hypothetical protein